MRAEDVAAYAMPDPIAQLGRRLDVIEARLDDIAAMLGEAFDQMHPCQECIDERVRTTARPSGVLISDSVIKYLPLN